MSQGTSDLCLKAASQGGSFSIWFDALGRTGDIAVRAACSWGIDVATHIAQYNALGAEVQSFEANSYGGGGEATFGSSNRLFAAIHAYKYVSYLDFRFGSDIQVTAQDTGTMVFGSLDINADSLGNFFFAPKIHFPTNFDVYLPGQDPSVVPVPGATPGNDDVTYLMRGNATGLTYQAGFTGKYTPDDTGGVLRYGSLQSTLDLGCGPLSPSQGSGYVARIGGAWNCLYSRALPVEPTVISDHGGAVLYATSSSPVNFGCGTLPAAQGGSTFIARLDDQGECLMTVSLPVPHLDVALSPSGGLVASGLVRSTPVDLGGGALAPMGPEDIVIVSLDASGSHVWSKRFGAPGAVFHRSDDQNPNVRTASVRVAASGDVYLHTMPRAETPSPTWTATMSFGGAPVTSGEKETIVASFSPNGAHRWSRAFHFDGWYSSTIDPCGALVVFSTDQGLDPGCGPVFPPPYPNFPVVPDFALLRFAP